MFTNRTVTVPIDEIVVKRDRRQRSNITPDSVLDLACLIGRNQWISSILLDQDTNELIAGERRLTAVRLLRKAVNGDFDSFSNPTSAKARLYPVCSCKVDSWDQWSRIPAQLGKNFTEQDLLVYEFIENVREDLCWQDRAKAVYHIHTHGLQTDKDWNNAKTGELVGLDHSTVAKHLRVWRMMEDNPSKEIQLIVSDSPTLQAALQNLQRYTSRRDDTVISLKDSPRPGPADKPRPSPGVQPGTTPIHPETDEPEWDEELPDLSPSGLGEQLLTLADARDWAAGYAGKPFNFLHCDFPYGIDFNTGEQANSVNSRLTGDYDDDPKVYWDLLETLVAQRQRLIAESAHVMFWFSQNLRKETEAFFRENFPDAILQDFLMIWHCTDLDGTVPDSQRYGRRTYETAMLLTFGDRKIVAPRALSFAHPRGSRSRIHRSQKPAPVLSHFMGMFVDNASSVLDLTAGSGTSLLVAHQLGAKRVVGLENNPETHRTAVAYLNQRSDQIAL